MSNLTNLNQIFTWLVDWTEKTFTPLGAMGLFWLAFIEASFFPIPPDILLVVLVLAKPEWFIFYAAICTLGSVLGALLGYFIGYKGGLPLLRKLVNESKIKRVHNLFNKYEAWAVGIAGLTPIPYKIATIAGGVFYVNIKKFIIASVVSRGARYLIVATLVFFLGAPVLEFISNYFDILTVVGVVVLILLYLVYRKYKKRKKGEENKEGLEGVNIGTF